MEYQLIRSNRKTIAIEVTREGSLIVRAPKRCAKRLIEELLREKEMWILQKQREFQNRRLQLEEQQRHASAWTETDYQKARERAKVVLEQKTRYYASCMQVSYGRITIRDQKTRWGSCSGKGNLNFNWRLILAPESVQDYVVVHELAHRREMNHSPAFWKIVEQVMPDYRMQKQWLKEHGEELMLR